jgi:hypothetical protein
MHGSGRRRTNAARVPITLVLPLCSRVDFGLEPQRAHDRSLGVIRVVQHKRALSRIERLRDCAHDVVPTVTLECRLVYEVNDPIKSGGIRDHGIFA